ncbi:MAG TPA: 30S ribosomal protein S20 [Bacteroidetes bacterium]|nr:30S ribosomal protein S20 [Bacteroidota bacterium]
MPHHKSCIKRIKTSERARARNRHYKVMMRKAIRQVREAGSRKEAETAFVTATKVLDRLAGKGIIHRNRAADKKSRLNALIRNMPAK